MGDEKKGSHEASCHEGSGASGYEGHEGDEEEGSNEAPCHEGSSTSSHEGHEGDAQEGSHQAPCHEGSCASANEGHEGHEMNIYQASGQLQVLLIQWYCPDLYMYIKTDEGC